MRITTLTSFGLVVLSSLVTACSCNEDYSFPEVENTEPAAAPEDFGSWLSMGVAPDGERLTIAYWDRLQGALGFAVGHIEEDGSVTWSHEQVDGYPEDGLDRGDRGRYTSHAVTTDGKVYVSYQDTDNGVLKVATRTAPSTWTSEVVDAGAGITSSEAGLYTSLAIRPDNTPIVAHYDAKTTSLRVAALTDGTWQKETAYSVTDGDVGKYPSVVVDGDTTYIAFYNATQGNLELLEGSFGSWTHTEIDVTGDVGQWPDLKLVDGELMVAYQNVGEQDLMFARRSGGTWTTEIVDNGPFRGADTSLFMRGGEPSILYFDGHDNDLWIAESSAGSWSTRKLAGDDGAVGFHNESVVLGDQVFVGSYDFTARGLVLQRL